MTFFGPNKLDMFYDKKANYLPTRRLSYVENKFIQNQVNFQKFGEKTIKSEDLIKPGNIFDGNFSLSFLSFSNFFKNAKRSIPKFYTYEIFASFLYC